MKDINLLVWLTQLGLSVVVPLAGFILLAVWLHQEHGWSGWVIAIGVILGLVFALDGLRYSLKAMSRISKNRKEEPPAVSFNDHE